MKIIPVHDPKNRERTAKESDLLSLLAHKHIIRLVEQWESKEEVVLVLDLCEGGDFLDRLNNGGKFTELEARRYFKQLTRALAYMHSKGVVHRDIKLDNLGIKHGDKSQLEVLDFGFAENYQPDEILTVSCGTLEYAAPELLRPRGQVFYKPEAIDVWSAGVCLYAFVTGKLPFEAASDEDFIEVVKDPTSLQVPTHLSPALQQLIVLLLNVDPAQRPSFSQILHHPWLCSGSQTPKAPARDPLTPQVARKRPKQSMKEPVKEASFWRSILTTLKIAEP
jgi:serine/threonine protein kinase